MKYKGVVMKYKIYLLLVVLLSIDFDLMYGSNSRAVKIAAENVAQSIGRAGGGAVASDVSPALSTVHNQMIQQPRVELSEDLKQQAKANFATENTGLMIPDWNNQQQYFDTMKNRYRMNKFNIQKPTFNTQQPEIDLESEGRDKKKRLVSGGTQSGAMLRGTRSLYMRPQQKVEHFEPNTVEEAKHILGITSGPVTADVVQKAFWQKIKEIYNIDKDLTSEELEAILHGTTINISEAKKLLGISSLEGMNYNDITDLVNKKIEEFTTKINNKRGVEDVYPLLMRRLTQGVLPLFHRNLYRSVNTYKLLNVLEDASNPLSKNDEYKIKALLLEGADITRPVVKFIFDGEVGRESSSPFVYEGDNEIRTYEKIFLGPLSQDIKNKIEKDRTNCRYITYNNIIEYAESLGNRELVSLLNEFRSTIEEEIKYESLEPDSKDMEALEILLQIYNKAAQKLKEYAKLTPEKRQELLLNALVTGNIRDVKNLVDLGIDINAELYDRTLLTYITPLEIAINNRNFDLVKYLINQGANGNSKILEELKKRSAISNSTIPVEQLSIDEEQNNTNLEKLHDPFVVFRKFKKRVYPTGKNKWWE